MMDKAKEYYDLVFYKKKKETGVVGTIVIMITTILLFSNAAATTIVGSIGFGIPVDAEDVRQDSRHWDIITGTVHERSRDTREFNMTQNNLTAVNICLNRVDRLIDNQLDTHCGGQVKYNVTLLYQQMHRF